MIIAKWLQYKDIETNHPLDTEEYNKIHQSPAIITTMIDIFLRFANNEKDGQIQYRYVVGG